jgi:selenophosphate synthetase-related protein
MELITEDLINCSIPKAYLFFKYLNILLRLINLNRCILTVIMLKKIAEAIKQNQNISEKKLIKPIINNIFINSYKSKRIFSDIGEDSAAIDNDKYLTLITTDRIKTVFVEKYPFGAGLSSILVGSDDIYCCGGQPLAASLIISYKDEKVGQQIIEGACEGSKKFKIPIIRGHTNPKGDQYELSSTIVGEIEKSNYISAKMAHVDDLIILAQDFEGKIGKASKYYWDTITFKSSEKILLKRRAMQLIAGQRIAHSAKDISNGGIFGTILQLIEYSHVGAEIDINQIEMPPVLLNLDYDLVAFSRMYLTTSFIVTSNENDHQKVLETFRNHGYHAKIIGKIIKETPLLRIKDGDESIKII